MKGPYFRASKAVNYGTQINIIISSENSKPLKTVEKKQKINKDLRFEKLKAVNANQYISVRIHFQ